LLEETSNTTIERRLIRHCETGSATAGRFLGWDLRETGASGDPTTGNATGMTALGG